MVEELNVVNISNTCEGSPKVKVSNKVSEPTILITGYYRAPDGYPLEYCTVVVPERSIKRRMGSWTIYYHLPSNKKVRIYWGSPYDAGRVVIEEITDEDLEEIKKLKELERLLKG